MLTRDQMREWLLSDAVDSILGQAIEDVRLVRGGIGATAREVRAALVDALPDFPAAPAGDRLAAVESFLDAVRAELEKMAGERDPDGADPAWCRGWRDAVFAASVVIPGFIGEKIGPLVAPPAGDAAREALVRAREDLADIGRHHTRAIHALAGRCVYPRGERYATGRRLTEALERIDAALSSPLPGAGEGPTEARADSAADGPDRPPLRGSTPAQIVAGEGDALARSVSVSWTAIGWYDDGDGRFDDGGRERADSLVMDDDPEPQSFEDALALVRREQACPSGDPPDHYAVLRTEVTEWVDVPATEGGEAMRDGDFALALPFDTDDPRFAHGVEIGRLWEALSAAPDEPLEQLVHIVNVEMCLRIGEALGRHVTGEEHDDTWMTVRFAPVEGGDDAR